MRELFAIICLAGELSMTTHHLSMILNIHFEQNFYNFINSYRVNEAMQRLADPEYSDRNILEIAYGA
jgi:AraC-like DNA-binding protein